MATCNPAKFCDQCRELLGVALTEKVTKEHILADGCYHLARFYVAWEHGRGDQIRGLREFFSLVKAHKPGIIFHRVQLSDAILAYSVWATHPDFPASKPDRYIELPLLRITLRREEKEPYRVIGVELEEEKARS